MLLDLSGGTLSEGDGDRENISLTYGRNFADGRGNFSVSASYANEDGIRNVARSYASRAVILDINCDKTEINATNQKILYVATKPAEEDRWNIVTMHLH